MRFIEYHWEMCLMQSHWHFWPFLIYRVGRNRKTTDFQWHSRVRSGSMRARMLLNCWVLSSVLSPPLHIASPREMSQI